MTAKNSNLVSRSQWRKWDESERELFNNLYFYMCHNMELFLHPKQKAPSLEHWEVTAWNAAWIAADELRAKRKASKE